MKRSHKFLWCLLSTALFVACDLNTASDNHYRERLNQLNEFSQGFMDFWFLKTNTNYSYSIEDGELQAKKLSHDSQGNSWDPHIGLSMSKTDLGKTYMVRFEARSDREDDELMVTAQESGVDVDKDGDNYTRYNIETFILSNEYETFSITFSPTATLTGAMIQFRMGWMANGSTLFLRNVTFIE